MMMMTKTNFVLMWALAYILDSLAYTFLGNDLYLSSYAPPELASGLSFAGGLHALLFMSVMIYPLTLISKIRAGSNG